MFAIGDQVLGLQAHPEFTPEVMARVLAWLRTQLDAEEILQIEQNTAGRDVDNPVMAQWIVNFLLADVSKSEQAL